MTDRSRGRLLYALFAVYVAATALHIAWVLRHEPFSFDAWNVAVDTKAQPFTVHNFFAYWWGQYTHSNPRLGQPLTYLGYKLEYVAEVALPLCLFAITGAAVALGLGRLPWRHRRGIALWAIAIGFSWFALPQLGRNMFCRAYGLNYLFGAAVQLWFLVPLRLVPTREASTGRCAAYALIGIAAGMCNEHTGPALLCLLAGLAWWHHRRGEHPRLLWAGAIGFFVGFCLIFFAPGQGSRYEGLAQQMSLFERLLDHGLEGNLIILTDFYLYGAPVLLLTVIALVESLLRGTGDADRRNDALRLIGIALAVGTIIAATLFVSPKLGARFYFVGLAMLLSGFLALVDAVVVRARMLVPLVTLAVLSSAYAAYKTIPLYNQVGAQGAQRMAELESSKRGSVYVADAFVQIDESWWFIGDDFRDFKKREMVADYFDLAGVFFRGYHPHLPLGLMGIRIVPRYWTEGASCAADFEGFEFGVRKGFDIAAHHDATQRLLAILRSQLRDQKLERFELPIAFAGERPPLPRNDLILSRWTAKSGFEGYTAKFVRHAKQRAREIVLSPELAAKPMEIYGMLVGDRYMKLGTTEKKSLSLTPWGKGVYWVLACDQTTCWVVAATRM